MGFNIGSVFGSALSPIGGLLNGITGVTEQTDRTYEQQMKAMNVQNAYNTAMWNLQNQYNAPVAQLARMREAGIDINPTSYALGTGNLSNTAVHVGSAGGFSGSGSPAGNPITMATGVANSIQDLANKKSAEKLNEEQTRATKTKNDIDSWNLEFWKKRGLPVGGLTMPNLMTEGAQQTGSWLGDFFSPQNISDQFADEIERSFREKGLKPPKRPTAKWRWSRD